MKFTYKIPYVAILSLMALVACGKDTVSHVVCESQSSSFYPRVTYESYQYSASDSTRVTCSVDGKAGEASSGSCIVYLDGRLGPSYVVTKERAVLSSNGVEIKLNCRE